MSESARDADCERDARGRREGREAQRALGHKHCERRTHDPLG